MEPSPAAAVVLARKSLVVALALVALGTATSRSFAAETPLTLAAAQQRAVERSRQLVAQDAAANAAREMAVAAGQMPDPVASLSLNNLPVDGPDAWSTTRDFMTMKSIGVMQEWTREEKRRARAERYEREADKALAERAARVATLRRDTALAWLDVWYADAQVALVAEQRRRARVEIDAAETAYAAGRGSLSDILAARSAAVMLDDRASALERRARAARTALARWIGEPAAAAPLAAPPQLGALPFDARVADDDLAHHPQIMALAKAEDVAAAEVRVAQANRKPDWSVQLMYSLRGSAYSNMISVGVSVPLQLNPGERQDREVAAKLALLDQARAEREDMARAHAAEVRAMAVEWESDRARVARYEREIVPLARERSDALASAYRGGRSTLADVLAAQRAEIDARLQALELEADAAKLWAQLAFLDLPASAPTTTRSAP